MTARARSPIKQGGHMTARKMDQEEHEERRLSGVSCSRPPSDRDLRRKSSSTSSLSPATIRSEPVLDHKLDDFNPIDVANGQMEPAVAARVAAVAGVQSALDTQEAKQETDKAAHEAAIAQEVSDRQTAVAAEAASRASDVAGLQSQITNVLGGALAEDLNSLSEIIAAYQAGDTTLANQAASMLQRIADLEAVVNELTSQSL